MDRGLVVVGADAKHDDRQVDGLEQLTDVSHTGTDWAYLQDIKGVQMCIF